MACDGIFDVMNNTEVIKFVRSRLSQRVHPKEVRILKITSKNFKYLKNISKQYFKTIFRKKYLKKYFEQIFLKNALKNILKQYKNLKILF